MNTLNKKVTERFFVNGKTYNDLVALWSKKVQDKAESEKLTAVHHLLYSVLRGKDWRKGFSPTTNEKKLINGMSFYDGLLGLYEALSELHSYWDEKRILEPFSDLINVDTLILVRELVPEFGYNKQLEKDAYNEIPDEDKVKAVNYF